MRIAPFRLESFLSKNESVYYFDHKFFRIFGGLWVSFKPPKIRQQFNHNEIVNRTNAIGRLYENVKYTHASPREGEYKSAMNSWDFIKKIWKTIICCLRNGEITRHIDKSTNHKNNIYLKKTILIIIVIVLFYSILYRMNLSIYWLEQCKVRGRQKGCTNC